MSELVKVDYELYGIEETKAKEIALQFKPMLDLMESLEVEANAVFQLDYEDPETAKIAKEVRLKFVKVRTGTSEIHKIQKAFYLSAGRYVDGFKNVQAFASQGMEERLDSIEKHAAITEKKRTDELQSLRSVLIADYIDDLTGINLGTMQPDVFDGFLAIKKSQKAERLKAEEEAENVRLAEIDAEKKRAELLAEEKAKADKLIAKEQLRIAQENEKLKAEAKEREAKAKLEAEAEAKKRSEEKAIQDEIINKERLENARVLAEAKAKSDKIERELQERKAEEENLKAITDRKAEAERKTAKEQSEAPLKAQLTRWVEGFDIPLPVVANDTTLEIAKKFNAFKKWAKLEIEKI
jgi:hypothetical protein